MIDVIFWLLKRKCKDHSVFCCCTFDETLKAQSCSLVICKSVCTLMATTPISRLSRTAINTNATPIGDQQITPTKGWHIGRQLPPTPNMYTITTPIINHFEEETFFYEANIIQKKSKSKKEYVGTPKKIDF